MKTAITTPFRLCEFPFISFGLRNDARIFLRSIDHLFRESDFAYAYIDDILLVPRDEKEHESYLKQLSERLQ